MRDLFPRQPDSIESEGLKPWIVSRGSGHAVEVRRWEREQQEKRKPKDKREKSPEYWEGRGR